ncbi:ATP-binding protein [Imhoffiella purpurea]|uniref:histidine kinase n=1 Tax=Imhoffiella purpurea TaxID=1249627 RepID=W9VF10_9GAMM|nr:ATP-binding protein [Imhoffiella purpurea]EXJ14627.1 hypothetical protein D779_2321 [Imhoffiella purpurea]
MPVEGADGWLVRWLGIPRELSGNPELQSALVRLATCVLGSAYIGAGIRMHYYQVDIPLYLWVFGVYLLTSCGLLVSVMYRPVWRLRRYLSLSLDVVVVSLAILIIRDAISPFYLLYILIFISAGTRYGRGHLYLATLVAVVAYVFVLIQLDEWRHHPFEASFFLLLLILLPLYLGGLLRRVQVARDQAERANRAKGDFLAVMTHELRTPLAGLVGMVELLKTSRLDEEQRDYVRDIDAAANSLSMLIGDVLDLSKIEAGRLELETLRFDPRDPMREVCGVIESKALEAGLDLICRVGDSVPRQVVGDPLRVRQILFNLVGNALKFTPEGHVALTLDLRPPEAGVDAAHLLFEVEDTGIGIPADKLEILFEGFRQIGDSTTRRFGGTGLGTTISRNLARLMGGSIQVESREGLGSRFLVRLPLLDPVLSDPDSGTRLGLGGVHVLVDEPNPLQREVIVEALSSAGCSVSCPSESERIESDPNPPDLLLIGDHPAGRDFEAALESARRILGGVPPILLLTYPGRRPLPRGRALSYLNKPFLPDDLLGRVRELMGHEPAGPPRRECEPASALTPIRSERSIRVLVAEDTDLAAKVLLAFLERMGVECDRFSDGETALRAALTGVYRLAIVDLHMPKLDGVGFAGRYRDLSAGRRLPIVALTASASEEAKRNCLEAGMDAFLVKPVRPQDLRETIERLAC